MPQQPPNPEAPKRTKTVDSLVRAEKLTQIAFILPAAVVVGWLGGAGLDKWLHQHWIYLAGIILGCVAGFIQIFRLVLGQEKQLEKEDRSSREPGKRPGLEPRGVDDRRRSARNAAPRAAHRRGAGAACCFWSLPSPWAGNPACWSWPVR